MKNEITEGKISPEEIKKANDAIKKHGTGTIIIGGEVGIYTSKNRAKLNEILKVIKPKKKQVLKNAMTELEENKYFLLSIDKKGENYKKTNPEIEKIEKTKSEIKKAEKIILEFIETTNLKTGKITKKSK